MSDSAEMAIIEFVDFNSVYTSGTSKDEASTAKKKRTRRGKKSSGAATTAATAAATTKEAFTEEVEKASDKATGSEEE